MNQITKNDVIVQDEGGNLLTYADMRELIRKEVSKDYCKYKVLRSSYDIDDIVNDVCLYYLSPMKHYNETRLSHYVNKHKGVAYIKNLIKLTSRQWVGCVLRDKHVKHNAYSLNTVLSDADNRFVEFQDLIVDETIDLDARFNERDFLVDIIKDLREYNKKYLFSCARQKDESLSELEFICSVQNNLKIGELNEMHYKLIQDLIYGYKVKDLKKKYTEFNYLMNSLKEVLSKKYLLSLEKELIS